MTKRLCPDTDQNNVKTVPKYAMAPGAEAKGANCGNQKFLFNFSPKINRPK